MYQAEVSTMRSDVSAPAPSVTRSALKIAIVGVAALAISACSGLSTTEERILSGGAIGAGVGAAGTAITGGCIACGAAIGGAVGAGTGAVIDLLDD